MKTFSYPYFLGKINGLKTSFIVLPAQQAYRPAIQENTGLVYLFTGGNGLVEQSPNQWVISEISVLAPQPGIPLQIEASDRRLDVLELMVELSDQDKQFIQQNKSKYPFFQAYSSCQTYWEKIKSPSHTLLPEHTFPRLCVGSVQTTGPDRVLEHRHSMLE